MKPTFSQRRRQVLMASAAGAGAVAAPVMAMPVIEATAQGDAVVSGRVVSAADGKPLAGAQIEIWNDAVRAHATADGDGRYFVAVGRHEGKLNYRVTHQSHTTQITQLRLAGTPQRSVARVRDDAGATRASFEVAMSHGTSFTPQAVTL
jgi:hypothetical protein